MPAFGAAGAIVYATGATIAPAFPTGTTATDAVFLVIASKDDTATHTPPAGWTALAVQSLAQGSINPPTATGIDVGPMKITIYQQDTPVAGQSGTVTISGLSSNVSWAQIVRFTKTDASAIWDISAKYGNDTTGDTSWSAQLTGPASTASGDMLFFATALPTDTNPTAWNSQVYSGLSITPTLIGTASSTSGRDIGGRTQYVAAPGAGSQSVTWAATLTGTVTNAYGPAIAIVMKEIVAPAAPTSAPALTIPTPERIDVSLSAVSGAHGYTIDYSSDGGSNWLRLATDFNGTITGLNAALPTTSYVMRYAAVNAAGTSGWSPTSAPITPNPAAPSGAVAGGIGKNTVTIYRRSYAAVYKVYRGLAGGARSLVYTSPSQVANGSFTWDDTGLTNEQAYDYHITTQVSTPTTRESAASPVYTATPSTSITYYPVSTNFASGWTYFGPGTASGCLDANLTTYIQGGSSAATAEVNIQSLTAPPAGSPVRFEAYVDIGAGTSVTLRLDGSFGNVRTEVVNGPFTGAVSYSLTDPEIALVDWDSMQFTISAPSNAFTARVMYARLVVAEPVPAGEIHTTTGSATRIGSTTAVTSTVRTKTGSTQRTGSVTATTSTVRTKTGSTQRTGSVTAVTTTQRTTAANAAGIRSTTRTGSSTRATVGNMTSVHTTTDVTDSVFPEIHTSTGSATRVGSVTAVTSKRAVTAADAIGVRSVTFVDSKRATVAANAAGIRSTTAVTTTVRTKTGSTQRTGSVTWTTSTVRPKTGSTQRTGSVTATTTTLRTLAMDATRVGSTTSTGSSTRSTTGQMISVHTVTGQTFGNGEIHTSTGTAAMLHTTLSTSSKRALSTGNAPGVRTIAATTTTRRTTAANASGVRSLTSATSTRRTVTGSAQAVVSLTAATTTNRGTSGATSLTPGASGTVSTTRSSTGTAQVVLGVSWIVRGAFQHQWLLPGTAVLDTQPTATATLSPAGPATSVIVVTPAGTSTVTPEGPAVVVVTPEGPASAAIAPAGAATAILEPVAAGTAALTQE
jgi:hypothetical protein